MRRILVPSDLSEAAAAAVPAAATVATAFGASVVLLHVVEPLEYAAGGPLSTEARYRAEVERAARVHLASLAGKLRSLGVERVEVRLRAGTPFREVLTELEGDFDYDAVVIASHGRTGVRRLIVGSVAEEVVAGSPCPVFVVRASKDAPSLDAGPVLVATDLSEASARAVRYAAGLASRWGADLEIAHVAVPPAEYGGIDIPVWVPLGDDELARVRARTERALEEFVEGLSLDVAPRNLRAVVLEGPDAAGALASRASEGSFRAIVLGTHGAGHSLRRALPGRVFRKVLRATQGAVVAVPANGPAFSPESLELLRGRETPAQA